MAILNHDDVLQFRRVGHEIGDQALTGKFPVRNVSDNFQQLLQQHFVILLDGTKPKERSRSGITTTANGLRPRKGIAGLWSMYAYKFFSRTPVLC